MANNKHQIVPIKSISLQHSTAILSGLPDGDILLECITSNVDYYIVDVAPTHLAEGPRIFWLPPSMPYGTMEIVNVNDKIESTSHRSKKLM